MLVQLWVQVHQEDTSFHRHLLLLLVHLEESAQAGTSRDTPGPLLPRQTSSPEDVIMATSACGQLESLFNLRGGGILSLGTLGYWEEICL